MSHLIFWASALLLVYTHIGYPALIWGWARWRPRRVAGADWEPSISVLIAAHNEGQCIEAKIENLLTLDYPAERLKVLIGSDGSIDDTVTRARRLEGPGVQVLAFASRRGKPAVLNDLARRASGEILVMADARQRFDKGALRALVRPFIDPSVGAVGGELVLLGEARGLQQGVGAYWRYEVLLRRSESLVDSTVGATGAIYALRRALFEPLPSDTLLDDVLLPLLVARRGYRVIFTPEAVAFDRAPTRRDGELTRKTRTIAGTFQLLRQHPWVLLPWRNRLWFQTLSHKGLRLLGPLLLSALFLASLALSAHAFYRLALGLQLVFYALGVVGAYCPQARSRFLTVPYAFCVLTVATIFAFGSVLAGRQRVTWPKASG